MTDDQLERAARRLCEKRGIDPDEWMCDEWGWTTEVRQWENLVPELRAHLEREQAIREAQAEAQREGFDPLWEPCKHDNYAGYCRHCEGEANEAPTLKNAIERCLRPDMPPSRPITFSDKP